VGFEADIGCPDVLAILAFSIPLMVGPPPERSSAFMSSDQLEQLCLAPDDDPEGRAAACNSYLAGAVDQLILYLPDSSQRNPSCPVKAETISDFRKVFLAYMRRNPGEQGTSAASTLAVALAPMIRCAFSGE
jgi:hypothetical protein